MSRWRLVAPMEHHRSMTAAGLRVRLVVTTSEGWPGWRWDVWVGGGPGQSVVYGAHLTGTSRLIADLLPLAEAKAAAMEWARRFGAELARGGGDVG